MGRPVGTKKIGDKWYSPAQMLAAGIMPGANEDNNQGVVKSTSKVIPFVTGLPVAPVEASTITPPVKVQGIHTHSRQEIKTIEDATGLTYAGSISIGTMNLVPVFLKPGSDEDRASKMTSIRHGF